MKKIFAVSIIAAALSLSGCAAGGGFQSDSYQSSQGMQASQAEVGRIINVRNVKGSGSGQAGGFVGMLAGGALGSRQTNGGSGGTALGALLGHMIGSAAGAAAGAETVQQISVLLPPSPGHILVVVESAPWAKPGMQVEVIQGSDGSFRVVPISLPDSQPKRG